jgi:hypothetical protein
MPNIQRKEEILESWLLDNCPHKSKPKGGKLMNFMLSQKDKLWLKLTVSPP